MRWLFALLLVFLLVGCKPQVEGSAVAQTDEAAKQAKLDRFKQLVQETDKIIEEDRENAQEILSIGLNPGDTPPDFTLTSLDGHDVSLHEEMQKGPTLVYFFATWCPECRNDFKQLEGLYEEYAEDVNIIAISKDLSESKDKLASFQDRYPGLANLQILVGNDRVLKDYNVIYTTTKYSINDYQKIEYFGSGELSKEQWITLLEGMKKKETKELTIV